MSTIHQAIPIFKSNIIAVLWADHKWNMNWQKNTSRLHTFIPLLALTTGNDLN